MSGDVIVSEGRLVTSDGTPVNDMPVGGEITFGTGTGGVHGETLVFPAAALATSATLVTTNSFSRRVLPDAASTLAVAGPFTIPSWWEGQTCFITPTITNDAGGAGNIRWTVRLLRFAAFAAIASPTVVFTNTFTEAAPGNGTNGLITTVISTEHSLAVDAFGSLFAVEITRLGSDGADTLAGNAGLVSVAVTRA